MKDQKQALILCGGKATRLRPYSYSCSKAQLPFLNLPLLSYPWKIAEELQNNSFLLNSHLFPEEFKKTVEALSRRDQNTQVFFEKEPLSSAGTLYALREELKKSSYFTYINGDCLLFPSSRQKLSEFEQEFLNSKAEALLFVIPAKIKFKTASLSWQVEHKKQIVMKEEKRFLYCDLEKNLVEVRLPQSKDKSAYFFTGLALFKSSLLDKLKESDKELFSDFLQPLLSKEKIKVFIDEEAFFLEAGDKESYLKSTEFCLKSLYDNSAFFNDFQRKTNKTITSTEEFFQEKKKIIKERLEDTFQRFDSQDKKVGLRNGLSWSQKLKALLLAPSSVGELDLLKVKGFAVISDQVRFYSKTQVENSVLSCPSSSLKGSLKEELLLTV